MVSARVKVVNINSKCDDEVKKSFMEQTYP